MLKRFKKKDGIGAIASVIILAAMIPLMLFTFVEVPYYNQYHRKMKSVVDSAAASAVTRIDEKKLASGIVELNYQAARTTMFENLQEWFSLAPYLYDTNVPIVGTNETVAMKAMVRTNPDESLLDADPLVIELSTYNLNTGQSSPRNIGVPEEYYSSITNSTRIEFFIHNSNNIATYTFTNGQHITVKTPTVGIYVEGTSYGIYFNWPIKAKKFGISEVVLDPYVADYDW